MHAHKMQARKTDAHEVHANEMHVDQPRSGATEGRRSRRIVSSLDRREYAGTVCPEMKHSGFVRN